MPAVAGRRRGHRPARAGQGTRSLDHPQVKAEERAAARRGADRELRAVRLDDLVGEIETKSGAWRLTIGRVLATGKLLENDRLVVRWNARTLVRDFDADPIPMHSCSQLNRG